METAFSEIGFLPVQYLRFKCGSFNQYCIKVQQVTQREALAFE
jgi:hypothetical protein